MSVGSYVKFLQTLWATELQLDWKLKVDLAVTVFF
jgi:hypothetical protein